METIEPAENQPLAEKGWGGSRPGQGRKPLSEKVESVNYQLRVSGDLHAQLKAKGPEWSRKVLLAALLAEAE